MRRPGRTVLLVLLVVLLVVVVPGGAVVVATKLIAAARGRRAVFDQVKAEFERQVAPLLASRDPEKAGRVARIVAAQAVVETGGGITKAWQQGWNFGNVRQGSTWKGDLVYAGDKAPDVHDVDHDGDRAELVPEVGVAFRKYVSLAAAVEDFLALLNWPRYRPARDALFAEDPALYAERLRNDDPSTAQVEGGYYTAPLAEYRSGILAVLASLA
jgi:flagellum-specific peptidoglycan hydrolase FlgJ